MDEKGFLIGIITRMKRIFSQSLYKEGAIKQLIQDGNREWITTIACICADGTSLSPGLIYQATSGNIQDTWLQDFDPMEHQCFFASSPSGWTNEDLGYQWLTQIFDKETKEKARRKWRLLILDGHGSHINMRFINYCDAHKILLAIYPPHSTHTLQPLDVALFKPLSSAYSSQLSKFMEDCQGLTSMTKRDFFRMFWQAWKLSFTPKNILSGFSATGLVPFCPDRVLNKFKGREDKRPSSSESSKSVLGSEDWRCIRALLYEVVTDIYDERVQKLNKTMIALSTENILLQAKCKGLENALLNEKKRQKHGKPLLIDFQSSQDGGAIFYSPSKIQWAHELQTEKEEAAQIIHTQKAEEKLCKEQEKEEKRHLIEERKRMKTLNKEMRLCEQQRRQHQKEEERQAKLANTQLQNDIKSAKKSKEKLHQTTTIDEEERNEVLSANVEGGAPPVVNQYGRQLRLPQRYRI